MESDTVADLVAVAAGGGTGYHLANEAGKGTGSTLEDWREAYTGDRGAPTSSCVRMATRTWEGGEDRPGETSCRCSMS